MRQHEADVERYLDEIRQLLPTSKEKKEQFLARYAVEIALHEEETGIQSDYSGLVSYFGTPDKIVKDYAYAWEGELPSAKTTTASRIPWKTIVFWICAALLLLCIVWLAYDFVDMFFTYGTDYKAMLHNGK